MISGKNHLCEYYCVIQILSWVLINVRFMVIEIVATGYSERYIALGNILFCKKTLVVCSYIAVLPALSYFGDLH